MINRKLTYILKIQVDRATWTFNDTFFYISISSHIFLACSKTKSVASSVSSGG